MKKIVNKVEFILGEEIIATIDFNDMTLSDVEEFKYNLSVIRNVDVENIDVNFLQKGEAIILSEMFIAVTGKLCYHNEWWNVEKIEGLSLISSLDLSTVDGFDKYAEYMSNNKLDELIKFN